MSPLIPPLIEAPTACCRVVKSRPVPAELLEPRAETRSVASPQLASRCPGTGRARRVGGDRARPPLRAHRVPARVGGEDFRGG